MKTTKNISTSNLLDYSIEKDTERSAHINQELSNDSAHHSPAQLEAMANYILFGKDSSGLNSVERKEIQIDTKYNSYRRKNSESIQELMENPSFEETSFSPIGKRIYTNPKPTLDKDSPELKELVAEIEKLQNRYDQLKKENAAPTTLYHLKHLLIDLKKQQYVIQEIAHQKVPVYIRECYLEKDTIDAGTDVYPLGLKIGDGDNRFVNPKEDHSNFTPQLTPHSIDLTNPTHIYHLIENYQFLYEASIDNPFSNTKYLVDTLDFYIGLTPLSDSRKYILNCKKAKITNECIRLKLNSKFGLNHNNNYISTIYTKEICKKISETVIMHFNKWQKRKDLSDWKYCSCCGQWKLKSFGEFVKKKSSLDGYSNKCKICEKAAREKKKLK